MFQTELVEKIKTHVSYSVTSFSENRAVYVIMSNNMVEPERTKTICQKRVAYWTSKPTSAQSHVRARATTLTHTHTHTQKYTYNTYCSPQQQWFRKIASLLRYMYIACLVTYFLYMCRLYFLFLSIRYILYIFISCIYNPPHPARLKKGKV
jgi:hypothetical protein